MLFGSEKPQEKTILLLDVESGSVGSAFVRISNEGQPKLFGESRILLPAGSSLSGAQLALAVEKAAHQALQNAADIAGRLRNAAANQSRLVGMGTVSSASIFLSPPWGKPNLATGRPDFLDTIADTLRKGVDAVFGPVKTGLYTAASAASHIGRTLGSDPILLCVVTAEVTELLLIDQQGVRAHATIPLGTHAVLRTLRSHGGISEQEARSALHLPFGSPSTSLRTNALDEAFAAAAGYFGEQFRDAAAEVLQHSPAPVVRVQVIAQEPAGEWFARALSQHEPLAALFPNGEVRALRSNHLTPYVAAHAGRPDLFLLLHALFVDSTSDTQFQK